MVLVERGRNQTILKSEGFIWEKMTKGQLFFIRKLGLGQTSCQRIVGVYVFKGVPEVRKKDERQKGHFFYKKNFTRHFL